MLNAFLLVGGRSPNWFARAPGRPPSSSSTNMRVKAVTFFVEFRRLVLFLSPRFFATLLAEAWRQESGA